MSISYAVFCLKKKIAADNVRRDLNDADIAQIHGRPRSVLNRFFFHDPATTEIYTLSLHDALPISIARAASTRMTTSTTRPRPGSSCTRPSSSTVRAWRSEEHTSELQSHVNLV